MGPRYASPQPLDVVDVEPRRNGRQAVNEIVGDMSSFVAAIVTVDRHAGLTNYTPRLVPSREVLRTIRADVCEAPGKPPGPPLRFTCSEILVALERWQSGRLHRS